MLCYAMLTQDDIHTALAANRRAKLGVEGWAASRSQRRLIAELACMENDGSFPQRQRRFSCGDCTAAADASTMPGSSSAGSREHGVRLTRGVSTPARLHFPGCGSGSKASSSRHSIA